MALNSASKLECSKTCVNASRSLFVSFLAAEFKVFIDFPFSFWQLLGLV